MLHLHLSHLILGVRISSNETARSVTHTGYCCMFNFLLGRDGLCELIQERFFFYVHISSPLTIKCALFSAWP